MVTWGFPKVRVTHPLLSACLFHLLLFLTVPTFQMTLVLAVTMFATIPAGYCAAEVVLFFDLLPILGILLTQKLTKARRPPITVMGLGRCSFVVDKTRKKRIRNALTI